MANLNSLVASHLEAWTVILTASVGIEENWIVFFFIHFLALTNYHFIQNHIFWKTEVFLGRTTLAQLHRYRQKMLVPQNLNKNSTQTLHSAKYHFR